MNRIEVIDNKQCWDELRLQVKPHSFLHSFEWGEFQETQGQKIYRLGLRNEAGDLIAAALFIFIKAKRGAFLFCPHGPLIKLGIDAEMVVGDMLAEAKKVAEQENCSFIRISPLFLDTEANRRIFKVLGFRDAPIHMHPELAWMVDVTGEPEQILAGMRKTTRQAIKKAESAGVTIKLSSRKDDLKTFFEIYDETVKRQHFTPFSRDFFTKEFEIFSADNNVLLGLAFFEDKPVACAFIVFDENAGYYHHGASTHVSSKVSAAQYLQWKIILEAKQRGCGFYNFWGIAPEDKPKHPWTGLSIFKKGFGGHAEAYVHAQDYILKPTYWFNYVIESIRRRKRGL